MDRAEIEGRTLNAQDVHDYAMRIATRAQESAETADRRIIGIFGPNFREHVIKEAEFILLALINHERSFAKLRGEAGIEQAPTLQQVGKTTTESPGT